MGRAAGGRGSLVAIEGPAGIGKSRLLTHAREKATASGWRVLDTRCTPMSTTIDYCLLRDWFSMLAHRAGNGTHPFDGPGQVLSDLSDGTTRGIGDLVYGVRWVLEDLTQDQPVLLVVDDLQWADVGSLQALDLLVNALQHLPCLIVYAVRTGEQVAAPETLSRIQQSSKVFTLSPLSRGAVAVLLQDESPEATNDDVAHIHDVSGGVPFFVKELMADHEAVPETVVGSIAGRLGRLSATATATARAVCVLGPAASVGTVAELAGLRLDHVADDISSLVAAQVLTLDHGRLSARHPLIAHAVLAHMSSAEAADVHAHAADILSRRGAARAVVAGHLLQTMPAGDEDVRARLAEQGECALAGGDHAMAIRYLERAIAEGEVGPEDARLYSALARARAADGQIEQALAAWDLAAGHTEDIDDLARLKAEAGDALVMAGRHTDAQEAFGALLDAETPERPAQQRLVARLVLTGMLTGSSVEHLREQVRAASAGTGADGGYDDRLTMAAQAVLSTFACENAAGVRRNALDAAGDGLLLQAEGPEGAGTFMAASALTWASAFEESEALLTSAIERAQSRGSGPGLATAASARGYARMRMGMVTEAIGDFESALAQRSLGWKAHLGAVLSGLVECRIARGEIDLAAEHKADLEGIAHQPGLNGTYATWALADLAEAAGAHDHAAALYAEVGQLVTDRMDNPAILPWRSGEALALIRLGRSRDAVPLAAENLRLAHRYGAPLAVAQGLRSLAAIDPTSDRVALLREALEVLGDIRALRLQAQVATDLAGMMVLHGSTDNREVVRLLRLAETHAGFQELRPLGERVTRLLERIGEPVKRGNSETVNALTVSERRVAELAASGLSNRQIAQQLFVTVKAVEWHLSNVYRKLGIRSRTRLPAVLAVPAPRSPVLEQRSAVNH
ncbi:AAA family ATPase [Nocardioides sp. MJB4]|uniref:AAA family ATPase n=2 Tax=Nocardioides donggukensis TaxID=2774019 RepID=A0A927K5W4_9ACTN|nr:AAA family ATPase [Nocardioides donggukensis]